MEPNGADDICGVQGDGAVFDVTSGRDNFLRHESMSRPYCYTEIVSGSYQAAMLQSTMPNTLTMTDPYLDCAPAERGRLESIVRSSRILSTVLDRWSSISLPDCWLSGTIIAQTAWNYALNLPCHHGLADIDLIYFDADDLSAEAEMRQSARVRDLLSDVPIRIDVKNEARVHLWYESKFG